MTATTDNFMGQVWCRYAPRMRAVSVRATATCRRRLITAYRDRAWFRDHDLSPTRTVPVERHGQRETPAVLSLYRGSVHRAGLWRRWSKRRRSKARALLCCGTARDAIDDQQYKDRVARPALITFSRRTNPTFPQYLPAVRSGMWEPQVL